MSRSVKFTEINILNDYTAALLSLSVKNFDGIVCDDWLKIIIKDGMVTFNLFTLDKHYKTRLLSDY